MRSVVDERRSNAPTARLMLTAAVRSVRAEWQALFRDPPPLFTIDITGLCVVWSAKMPRTTPTTSQPTTDAATGQRSARGVQ